jgi:peptidoglycan/xylan/chitin deacetylase (PgdA/CDA1 family)
VKDLIITLATKLGGLQLAKFLTRKEPRLYMYHSFSKHEKLGYVSAAEFEWQLKIIKQHFNPVDFLTLSKMIYENKVIPANTIVITIDDGYRNFYQVAYPLLKQYKIPATLFVTTGFVSGKLWLWPDQLKWILSQVAIEPITINCHGVKFALIGDTTSDWQTLNDLCLEMTDEFKHEFIFKLAELLKITITNKAPAQYESSTWKELAEMQSNGIEIGGHTVSHPSLGQVTLDNAEQEIADCLATINEKLGEQERTFCYPNGQPSDYNENIKVIVAKSGFVNAVTAFSDSHALSFRYSWRRFCGDKQALEFKKSLFGVEFLGNKLRKFIRCNY